MPVLDPLKPILLGMIAEPAGRQEASVGDARVAMHAMIDASFGALMQQYAPSPSERDYTIPVDQGDIVLRVYAPGEAGVKLPCHLHLHGGGFWLGTLDQSNSACRGLVETVGCVVVSVDYRLAPEHKFPVAAEDCYAALLWVIDHAGDLAIDTSRVSVGGGSAGANLAAVLTLMARDRHGPALVQQILEIPVTDFTDLDPVCVTEEGRTVPSGKRLYGSYYLSDWADADNPYASPLLCADLRGLPPALVMCAEYDPLRAEGEAYARKLAACHVPVEYRCWEGQFHGSQRMMSMIPAQVADYEAQITQTLRHAYGLPS